MPEGDTLARTAAVLAEVLTGLLVTRAEGRPGGAALRRAVGQHVEAVRAQGKHLLIDFSGGLTLHTHLGLHGSWHRYRSGERWRGPASRAVALLEVPGTVCVCFDAPTVELLETRALAVHPRLRALGADVAASGFDPARGMELLRQPARRGQPIGEVLLDQRAVAGLGNVYRSELCFLVRLSPFAPLEQVSDEQLLELLRRAARVVARSSRTGRRVTTAPGSSGALYVYGRTGRPCRRCGTAIRSSITGTPPRRVYWCVSCQPSPAGGLLAAESGTLTPETSG